MRNIEKLVKLIVALIIFLAILQVVISNRLSTLGTNLSLIEKEKTSLTEENEVLRQKIASASSLSTIASKAQRLGFENKASFFYLESQLPIALENLN